MRRLSAPSGQSRSQHLSLRIVDRISHYFLAVTQTKTRPTEHQKGFTKRISPVKLTVTPHIGAEGLRPCARAAIRQFEIAGRHAPCQSASDRDPRSASNRDPLVLRFGRLALAPSELVGVAEAGRARVGGGLWASPL